MTKKEITVRLDGGLETRPVALLVQMASQFKSDVYVESENRRVNAKSIMGMMTLGLDAGVLDLREAFFYESAGAQPGPDTDQRD